MTTLKNVLLLNAVSSGATGLGLILFPGAIAILFGVNDIAPFTGTGIFLIAFAMMVAIVGQRKPIGDNAVRFIILLDSAWVLASLTIIVLQAFDLTMIGYLAIAAVAVWVAAMAYLQATELKQLTTIK